MAIESIDSNVLNIGDLLDDDHLYEIPRFQRGYSWKDKNIYDFINDINNINLSNKEDSHFIGSIIYYKNGFRDRREEQAEVERHSVVDGQQRITTTLILLCALRDVAYELKSKLSGEDDKRVIDNRIQIIDGQLYPRGRRDINYNYLKLDYDSQRENDKQVMDAFLKGPLHDQPSWEQEHQKSIKTKRSSKKDSAHNIRNAYGKFYGLINDCIDGMGAESDKVDYLDDLARKIDRLQYIGIRLDSVHSAYNIFMTLNDRGEPLTNTDLIKSHISRILGNGPQDSFNSVWDNVLGTLKGGESNELINTSSEDRWAANDQWASNNKEIKTDKFFVAYADVFGYKKVDGENGQKIGVKNLFRYYEANLSSVEDINRFKASVGKESEIYRMVSDPNFYYRSSLQPDKRKKDDWKKIVGSLHALNLMGITQHTVFTYLLLRLYIIQDETGKFMLRINDLSKMFSALENFHFQYNGLFGYRTNAITDIYDDAVKNIIAELDDSGSGNVRSQKVKNIRNILKATRMNLKFVLDKNEVDIEKFTKKFKSLRYDDSSRRQKGNMESKNDFTKNIGFEATGKKNTFIQYVLSKYQPKMLGVANDRISIEHIYPQAKGGGEVHTIGNLMLLPRSVNETLGEQDVICKIDTLREYPMVKEIEIPDSWSHALNTPENRREEFNKRAELMARYGFENIWNIPSD